MRELKAKELYMKDFNGDKIFSLEYDKETLRDMVIDKQQKIERLHSIIKEARELLNQEWYSVLRKGTIIKVREILDKENQDDKN